MSVRTAYRPTLRRGALSKAIVEHVANHGTADDRVSLGALLDERPFSERPLEDLFAVAITYRVPTSTLSEIAEIPNTPLVSKIEATYLCTVCEDNYMVEVEPGRFGRCPNCNPASTG